MPVRAAGVISLTKFIRFADVLVELSQLTPGVTTAVDVVADPAVGDLWDDIFQYTPRPNTSSGQRASASWVLEDDELLRAARAQRQDASLLLWCALVIADGRLEEAVRTVITDSDGRFVEAVLSKAALTAALAAHPDFAGEKPITNTLRNMARAGLFEPKEHGQTIVGVDRFLPTAFAVPGLLQLLADRVEYWADDARFTPASASHILDFALALEANRWLGLTRDEFIVASTGPGPVIAPSSRSAVPPDLLELHDLLEAKGQVVLQGPPGTGKTHLAKEYISWASAGRLEESRLQGILDALPERERTPSRIADEVVRLGLTALWEIVQFHPSYEYNDFVRTLAAEPVPGGVTFVPRHRVLSLLAAVGMELERRGVACEIVLVLDEVNRGNIPSIFGELLYALEYRGQPVSTPYSVDGDASITLPQSMSVIATMNTADRSIAVIDYALRRRFVFLNVPSSGKPIDQHPGFVTQRHRDAARKLFDAVGAAVDSSTAGVQVGPSYYLPSRTGTSEDEALRDLASRFIYEVLPLLDEYVLEGELDGAAFTSMLASLGVDRTTPTIDQVSALQTTL